MNAEVLAPTWAVVMTVNDPKELVLANVAHHLWIGAQEVFVFLDAPDAELEAVLAGHERCAVMRCDETYWRKVHALKTPPRRITRRQSLNAGLAATRTNADWLVSLDADELLWCDGDFTTVLAGVPDKAGWLKLPPWERKLDMSIAQQTIFDGGFIGFQKDAEVAGYTQGGFTGHVVGKACVRMGRGYNIAIHNPRIGPIKDKKIPPSHSDSRAFLLHFDGLTPYHWGYKLLFFASQGVDYVRKNNFGKRRRQIGLAARAAQDDHLLQGLLLEIGGISPQEASRLDDLGLRRDLHLGIKDAVRAEFPNIALDLSAAGYNALIEARFEAIRKKVVEMGDVWDFTT